MRYIVQHYSRYAIYEPAEGGYYYEGLEPDDKPVAVFDTEQEAIDKIWDIAKCDNEGLKWNDEGFLAVSNSGTVAYTANHKYIGDGEEYYVEPLNRRGRHRKGRVPYQ